jgi:O-antigen/teichoic acid export membrane protein
MLSYLKSRLYPLLRRSEKYTKTDMVYLVSSNFWLTVPRFVLLFAGMGLTVAFANLLTPQEFGTYKYVLATAGFIGAFSLSSMGQSVMRFVAQGKPHVVPHLVRTMMLWSLPASIVTLVVSGYYFAHGNQTLGYGLVFIAVANVLSNGYGLSKSVMVATGDFKANTFSGFPRALLSIVIVLAALLFTRDVTYILLAYFGSNILLAWSLYRYSVRRLTIDGARAAKEDVSEAVRFGKHMSVLGFFMLISGQIDQLLLWHFTDAATLAIYTLALAPVKEVQNLLGNFATILFPRLARKSKEEVRESLPLRLRQMFLASVLLFSLYVLAVPFLFSYLFPAYLPSVLVSQALALTVIFQIKSVIELLLIAHGEVKKRYVATLSSQAIELALFCILIPLFGLWGAVWATVLSEAAALIALLVIYKRF